MSEIWPQWGGGVYCLLIWGVCIQAIWLQYTFEGYDFRNSTYLLGSVMLGFTGNRH